jgi:hypothetical protein
MLTPKDIATSVVDESEGRLEKLVAKLGEKAPILANAIMHRPLRSLKAAREQSKEDRDSYTSGFYTPFTREVVIYANLERFPGGLTPELPLGNITNVSNRMSTTEDALTASLVHELAHHLEVEMLEKKPELFDPLAGLFMITTMLGKGISNYAGRGDPNEWFAETMAAHQFWPRELERFDKQQSLAMKKVLRYA